MRLTNRARRGSALSLVVVVSIVLTGLVMALAWTASTHSAIASQIPRMDASYYAAEAGAEMAVWKFKHDQSWRALPANPFTGSIDMYNTSWRYAVTCVDQVGDATLAWKMDENSGSTTADVAGNGNIGTFHGGVSWYKPGRSGACIQLDGIDGYVDCGNNPDTNLTGDMSFSAWVKMNSGYYDQKIGGNQSGVGGGYKLCVYNSKLEFEVRDGNNKPHLNRDVAGGTILTMGTWYHLMGVYSESGHWIKTYVNGKLDRFLQGDGTGTSQTSLPAGALAQTSGNFVMGREPWTALYYFNGYLDDIRIWNRSLGDAEAKQVYDTTVQINASVNGGAVANLVRYTASIPTPPPPTIPAVTTANKLDLTNISVNGDLSADDLDSSTGTSTISGNLNLGKKYKPNSHIVVQGKIIDKTTYSIPAIDYAALQAQASKSGMVVTGDSIGQTFTFNSLGGNKVIWIKGNLQDPIVTIGGTYAAGGTFVVDGTVKFTLPATTLGSDGYPVYIVSQGDITQSGLALNLTGALYARGKLALKNCTIAGPLVANDQITSTATLPGTITTAAIPWFDTRAIPQPPTLPLYKANHTGIGP